MKRSVIPLAGLGFLLLTTFVAVEQVKKPQSVSTSAQTADVSVRFPMGVFEDIGMQGDDTTFTNTINDLKARGFDSILFTNGHVDTVDSRLRIADTLGFKVISGSMGTFYDSFYRNGSLAATIENARNIAYPVADRLKGHSSLLGYTVADDAGLVAGDLPNFQDKQMLVIQALQERDTTHPATTVLTPGYEWMYSRSAAKALVHYYYPAYQRSQMCDFYAVDEGNGGGGYYQNSGANSYFGAINLSRIKKDLKDPNHPFWFVGQTHGSSAAVDPSADVNSLRTPSPAELRLQQWLALAEGVDGFFWFNYSTMPPGQGFWVGLRDNQALYAEATNMVRRVGPLRSVLVNTSPVDDQYTVTATTNLGYQFRPYVRTHKDNATNKYYVFVVNKSCSNQSISVASTSLGGQLRDTENGQTYSLNQAIAFNAGDGKLFEVVNPTGSFRSNRVTNLLANPSFESTDGWATPVGSRDSTTVHSGSGNYSYRVNGGVNNMIYQNVNLKADTVYSLSFWVKTANVSGTGVFAKYVELSPHAGANRGSSDTVSGTTDWKRVNYIFYSPHNYSGSGSNGRFDIYFNYSSGTAWVDDVQLCEGISCAGTISSPTSPPSQPTNTPTQPTATPMPVGGGGTVDMPLAKPPYGSGVATWWNNQAMNPENPGSIPIGGIKSPANVVVVTPGANLQTLVNNAPNNTTFKFSPGTYINTQLDVHNRSDLHFVADTPGTVTIQGGYWFFKGCTRSEVGMPATGGDYYQYLSAALDVRSPAAHACVQAVVAGQRAKNFYFKNLVFDGNNQYGKPPTHFQTVNGVVYDNITWRNFTNPSLTDPGNFHDGHVNASGIVNNLWIRGSRLLGQAPVVTYLDGCHSCGLVQNEIAGSFGQKTSSGAWIPTSGGVGWWNNNDVSYDINGNGSIEVDGEESRKAQYVAMYGNTYNPGVYNTGDRTGTVFNGSHFLVARNRVNYSLYYFVVSMAQADNNNPNTDDTYRDHVIKENQVNAAAGNVTAFARPEMACYDFGLVPGNDCLRLGPISVTNNVIYSGNTIWIYLDANNTWQIIDSNNCKGSNCAAAPVPVQYPVSQSTPVPTLPPQATATPTTISRDLVVTNIAWTPASPKDGDNVVFRATIRNQGTSSTPANVVHGVLFSVDGQPVNWSDNSTTSIPAGGTVTLTANGGPGGGNFWRAVSGTHQVEAWVDDINRIAETDENNNKLVVSMSVADGCILPADANCDNKIDGLDYIIWATNYGNAAATKAMGDFNNDGRVDGADYIVWVNNYGI